MKDEQHMRIFAKYIDSVFQNFESFLKTEIDLVEDDIKLVLDEYISSSIIYDLTPGIYTFKDVSEALFNLLQLKYPESGSEIVIEFDAIIKKTILVVRPGNIAKRFDEQSFFRAISGFISGWDYKHYNKYTSQNFVNLGRTKKYI